MEITERDRIFNNALESLRDKRFKLSKKEEQKILKIAEKYKHLR